MKKERRTLALTALATICFAFLFIYSWFHAWAPTYLPNGRLIISPTVPLGAALLCLLVSLFFQLSGKK
jgi:hypothetical protein